MNPLSAILSSKVRAEIFRQLFNINNKAAYMRQMARRSGLAIGTVQSELKRLAQLNLITKRRDGNRLYYRANQEHPLFEDIKSL
ncbi:MAG: winged helix-turn-helix domain-containing protein, partial [Desulfobacterales bacterium]|nr:winged helix-turn-helix domain-containing protein [Desulfobacterales bacterium]